MKANDFFNLFEIIIIVCSRHLKLRDRRTNSRHTDGHAYIESGGDPDHKYMYIYTLKDLSVSFPAGFERIFSSNEHELRALLVCIIILILNLL